MEIQENVSLRPFTTFGVDVKARWLASFKSVEELEAVLASEVAKKAPARMVLGGGSNILFLGNYNGLLLRNEIGGVDVTGEDEDYIYVRSGAGENWHALVLHCIEKGYAGLENLSLIPGSVGASPMQNIGAYGVEIRDVFHSLEAFHIGEQKRVTFSLEDCAFGYRESVFKRKYRDQFIITSVTYRLRRKPVFHTEYGAIKAELERMGVRELSIGAISQAVINIRSSKLPDPKVIGNAGSFFKNPSITKEQFDSLKEQFPNIVGFKNEDGSMKLAAGWLIEQCGWKGFRRGDAGCHAQQALVLVNHGNATGKEIYDLSTEILESVRGKFGVELEREVNVVGEK